MAGQKTLGAQISHMLHDRGVRVIFGIPGVHNQEMYRGIEEAGIKHILARHEQGAGFMADGYARATGKVGVCYVITGPGLCNIMTPMGQGYSDSVSMLVLASALDETAALRGQLHQMRDQAAAARSICDWAEEARSPQAAYRLIDRALMEFEAQRKRPKYIQVPIKELEGLAPPAPHNASARMGVHNLSADNTAIADLAAALQTADRPVFVIGGGAVAAANDLFAVLQKCQAACFETNAGRGCIAPDYPLHFGSYISRPSSGEIMEQSDLVVAVGTELAEVDLWRMDLGHNAPLWRIDIDSEMLTDVQGAEFTLHARAEDVMQKLLMHMQNSSSSWKAAVVAQSIRQWQAESDSERPNIAPVAQAMQAALPDDVMIYSDMTQFAYVANEIWPMTRSGHWHHPTGFGTLGYALPAAIGGAVGRGGRPTVAIAGDYGFQYTVQELGTAVELGLNLPIIIWDNGKLKEIEDSMQRAQIAPNSVIAHNPDFLALARAYGANATAPQTLDEIAPAVQAAFKADCPTVIYLTPDICTRKN